MINTFRHGFVCRGSITWFLWSIPFIQRWQGHKNLKQKLLICYWHHNANCIGDRLYLVSAYYAGVCSLSISMLFLWLLSLIFNCYAAVSSSSTKHLRLFTSGDKIGLVGKNGCGKSTLFALIKDELSRLMLAHSANLLIGKWRCSRNSSIRKNSNWIRDWWWPWISWPWRSATKSRNSRQRHTSRRDSRQDRDHWWLQHQSSRRRIARRPRLVAKNKWHEPDPILRCWRMR